MENSIEEDIELLQDETSSLGLFFKCKGSEKYKIALEHILLDYKRVLKENDLLYPDADEIYERYYKIKEENEKLKNKDTNKVSLEIGKSKTIKKIYVSDKQIGLGILTNWTGRKLDFLFANKINELVQAVNQLSKKTEE